MPSPHWRLSCLKKLKSLCVPEDTKNSLGIDLFSDGARKAPPGLRSRRKPPRARAAVPDVA
jgi:hypothetical protein